MSNKQRVKLNSSEFKPKNEYLLIKPEELKSEEITESGLILKIEQSSMARPSSGTVIEVGSDIDDIDAGDFVLWPATDGLDIEFNDGDFMLLRYRSIIGSKK